MKMSANDVKKCKVTPRKFSSVPDILMNNKRIEEETELELNPNEIKRAMASATVSAIDDKGTERPLNPLNFNDAVEKTTTPSNPDGEEKKDTDPEPSEPSEDGKKDTSTDENPTGGE